MFLQALNAMVLINFYKPLLAESSLTTLFMPNSVDSTVRHLRRQMGETIMSSKVQTKKLIQGHQLYLSSLYINLEGGGTYCVATDWRLLPRPFRAEFI